MKSSLVFASMTLSLVGCGDDGMPLEETVPVTGIATYQGKPLEGYEVYFIRFDSPEARAASAPIGPDGKFTLGTHEPGDGAPVGSYRVFFAYSPVMEVEPGKEDQVVIPPPKVKLPPKYSQLEQSGISVEVPADGLTDYKLDLK